MVDGLITKSCLTLVTPWTVACPAPLSMVFSRQEYWNGLPFPSPGGVPNPGTEPGSSALQADSLPIELWRKPQYAWVHAKLLQSCLTLCDAMDIACQAPLPMGCSKQEYWSGLPCPPPEDLPIPGTEPESLMSLMLVGGFFTTSGTLS